MKIYGVPLSVHTRKIIGAARLKNIPYELQPVVPVIPGNPPPNWRELSPLGLIPAIEDEGFRLADSTAILHYLERKVPEPALLPSEPQALGTALFLDAWAGTALFGAVVRPLFHNQIVRPNINKLPADQSQIDAALRLAVPEAFTYLESLIRGSFLVGSAPSIADLAVVSNLIMFNYLGHRIGPGFPKLDTYFRRHLDSPLLSAILEAEKPFAAQMALDRTFIA
jgi:glutathione S-transferase